MAIYAQDIVKQAQAWVGLKESDNSHKTVLDVYNAHEPLARGYKMKTTDAWCACFVSAVAIKCGATAIIPTEVSCGKQIELFKALGVWIESDSYKPAAGDIIYYDWGDSGKGDNTGYPDHVGIVEKRIGENITVIEGNISNKVGRRVLKVNGKNIRGYASPKYDTKASKNNFAIGDTCSLARTATYYNGKSIPTWVKNSVLYVREINGDRVVISTLRKGAITGAVHIKDLIK